MPSEFKNEPLTNFGDARERQRVQEARSAKVSSELGKDYDLIIDGKRKKRQDRIRSLNPSDPKIAIGTASKAGRATTPKRR